MGRRLAALVSEDKELKLAAATEAKGSPHLGADAGELAGVGPLGVRVTEDVPRGVDCIVDFSFHGAAPATARRAVELGANLVMGTTGLSAGERASVEEAAKKIALVLEPNMSVGVNLLFETVGALAAALGPDYDVEIVETHHRFKKDAPSGTALRLAERIARSRGSKLDEVLRHGRKGESGERPRGEIGMHALRQGDVVGEHVVTYSTLGETVSIAHRAHSRDAFAAGALRAVKYLAGRKPGRYSMREVLGLPPER
jgi:4-hydroxy-tetrahydrodipicolinate reductase